MTITQAVELYVQHRRSLGMKFVSPAVVLKSFAKACEPAAFDVLDTERVRAFLFAGGAETRNAGQKWATLRGFYRFAVARDMVASSPLPATIPKVTKHFQPYIYTREEISRLLESTANLPVRTLQPHTVRMLVLTLYGSGLRCSEALRLRIGDLDLVEKVLHIHASKFYKDGSSGKFVGRFGSNPRLTAGASRTRGSPTRQRGRTIEDRSSPCLADL